VQLQSAPSVVGVCSFFASLGKPEKADGPPRRIFTAPRAETEPPGLAAAAGPALVLGAGHHHLSHRPGNAPEGKP